MLVKLYRICPMKSSCFEAEKHVTTYDTQIIITIIIIIIMIMTTIMIMIIIDLYFHKIKTTYPIVQME